MKECIQACDKSFDFANIINNLLGSTKIVTFVKHFFFVKHCFGQKVLESNDNQAVNIFQELQCILNNKEGGEGKVGGRVGGMGNEGRGKMSSLTGTREDYNYYFDLKQFR